MAAWYPNHTVRAAINLNAFPLFTDLDEELPDYIMVMVANKKTSQQMADDLSLFLGHNTLKFTVWYDKKQNESSTCNFSQIFISTLYKFYL